MSYFEIYDTLSSRFYHALAEKEKEHKEEKERWTPIESAQDEEISELNDLITEKDEQLKAEKETLAQAVSNLNELIAKKNKQLNQTKKSCHSRTRKRTNSSNKRPKKYQS